MKLFRFACWTIIIALIVGLISLRLFTSNEQSAGQPLSLEFTLTTHLGETADESILQGKPSAVFFGFTTCPEICPTSLYELSNLITQLGPKAELMNFVFVTVDPERDTPEVLENYISAFSSKMIGLTGSELEIEKIVKSFHVYREKVSLDDGDYTMDHTASVFLLRSNGSFKGTIAYGEDANIALQKLNAL